MRSSKGVTRAALLVALVALAGAHCRDSYWVGQPIPGVQVDDWCYEPTFDDEDAMMAPSASGAGAGNMGFAVGGAMDINNFRRNVEEGYLPLVTDVPYEGLFYDYYFDTGTSRPCTELFCPSYTQMRSTHPETGVGERYLSVGLDSGMREEDFERKQLNLVVVLDISGSMGSSFDSYYYDGDPPAGDVRSKMEIANESVVAMLEHLAPDDRFGMVLFESDAHLAKPLNLVARTDMEAIAAHILEITETGGTNMEAGYRMGRSLFDDLEDIDPEETENRIIFLTDAMPNTGEIGQDSLLGMVEDAAANDIFTTFIGIGVDFNTTLVNHITRVRGANYYSVHSSEEFAAQMDDDFDLMVTPLVFDLTLELESEGFAIDEVFGSPEADEATGTLLFVNTLFPSRVEAGETRGGLILVLLEDIGSGDRIDLTASYRDRSGDLSSSAESFTYSAVLDEAPNRGIRKGILLTRYASLMREWISFERERLGLENPRTAEELSMWERTSEPLVVSEEYQERIVAFLEHFREEAAAIGDESLEREVEILETLATY